MIKRLKFELKLYFGMRHVGIVQSFDGGFVYPKEEIKRLIKHIRRLQNYETRNQRSV